MHSNFSSLEKVRSECLQDCCKVCNMLSYDLQIAIKKLNKNKHEDGQENDAPTDSLTGRDFTSCLSIRKDSLASNIIQTAIELCQ